MSVTWFGVDITVEVAFTTAPLATTPTWTDVSAYVRDIRIDRGRSDEFSQFGPGTASVTFSNRDRRFDPNYSSGPYFGNLLPMKKIRIRATYSAVTYDRFVGFVQGWPQDYDFTFDSTVTVSCVDGSRFLASEELQRSAYEAAVMADSPIAYWPMQEQNTTSGSQFLEVTTAGTDLTAFDDTGGVALPASVQESAPIGAAYSTGAGGSGDGLVYQSNSHLSTQPLSFDIWCRDFSGFIRAQTNNANRREIGVVVDSDRRLISLSYFNEGANRLATTDTGIRLPTSLCHLAVTGDATNVLVYLNGQVVYTGTLTVGTGVSANDYGIRIAAQTGAVSHWANYSTTLSAARVQQHYLAGLTAFGHPYGERSGERIGRVLDEIEWPAADRTIGNGDTVHGPYLPNRQSAITYMQDVAVAEDGLFFVGRDGKVVLRDRQFQWTRTSSGTFSDDGSDIPYEAITIDANSIEPMRTVVSVTYGEQNAYLKVQDATNFTAYGPLLEPLSAPTVDSAAQSRALANYKLRTTKDPSTRITQLRVNPRAKAATAFPVLLGLEIGDRIVVERTAGNPVVGSQIVEAVTVQGYSESLTVEGEWLTSLYLSPAPLTYTEGPYLLTGDATYGRTGAAAGNKVAF